MAFGKRNQVNIDPFKYNIGLIGEAGIGKTTTIRNMCEKHLGEDGYLFIECGKEDGADAISGINYVNAPEWSMEYDEYSNSAGFEDIVDDIIEHKSSEYPNLRVVVIDTFDQLMEISKEEVVNMHNRLNPDKPVKTIKAAFGGFMAGDDKAAEIVLDKLWELKKVGVNFIIIGHVKTRQQTDALTGQEYTSLTTNMSIRDFNAIKTKLHFLGVAYIDRNIIQEKTGKKDINGKVITRNKVAKESRKVTFRDDNYSVDSKSRFANIVNEVPLDADEIYNALVDAIKSEVGDAKSYEKLKKEQDSKNAEHLKEIEKAEAEKEAKNELKEVVDKIVAFIKDNKSNPDVFRPIMAKVKELGYSNPLEITSIEDAKTVYGMIG